MFKNYVVSAMVALAFSTSSLSAASWIQSLWRSPDDKKQELEQAIREGRIMDVADMTTRLSVEDAREMEAWNRISDAHKKYIQEYAPYLNIAKVGADQFKAWALNAASLGHPDIANWFEKEIENWKRKQEEREQNFKWYKEIVMDWFEDQTRVNPESVAKSVAATGQRFFEDWTGVTRYDAAIDEVSEQLAIFARDVETGYIKGCIAGQNEQAECQAYLDAKYSYFGNNSVYWASFDEFDQMISNAVRSIINDIKVNGRGSQMPAEVKENDIRNEQLLALRDPIIAAHKNNAQALAQALKERIKTLPNNEGQYYRQLNFIFNSPIRIEAYRRYIRGEEFWNVSYGAPAKIKEAINTIHALIANIKSQAASHRSLTELFQESQAVEYSPKGLAAALAELAQLLRVVNRFLETSYGKTQSQEAAKPEEEFALVNEPGSHLMLEEDFEEVEGPGIEESEENPEDLPNIEDYLSEDE